MEEGEIYALGRSVRDSAPHGPAHGVALYAASAALYEIALGLENGSFTNWTSNTEAHVLHLVSRIQGAAAPAAIEAAAELIEFVKHPHGQH